MFLSKVSRNFELVGRVNLDQLEQMKGKTESSSSDEEEKEEELSPKTEERGQCSPFFFLFFFFWHCNMPYQSHQARSAIDSIAHSCRAMQACQQEQNGAFVKTLMLLGESCVSNPYYKFSVCSENTYYEKTQIASVTSLPMQITSIRAWKTT